MAIDEETYCQLEPFTSCLATLELANNTGLGIIPILGSLYASSARTITFKMFQITIQYDQFIMVQLWVYKFHCSVL